VARLSPGKSSGKQEGAGSKRLTCHQLAAGSSKLILATPGSRHCGHQRDPGIQDINHRCRLDIQLWAASLPIQLAILCLSREASQQGSRLTGKAGLHAALSPLSFLQSTVATTVRGCTSSHCRAGSSTTPVTRTTAAILSTLSQSHHQQGLLCQPFQQPTQDQSHLIPQPQPPMHLPPISAEGRSR
jgi:hypothetical protein